MDFLKNVKEIEKKIGYTFKDKSLLAQAFTRSSYCNEHKGARGEDYQSNEVLEFFGDSVLSAAIVTMIIRDFSERYEYGIKTKLDEGDFSNIKSKLSDKKNLSDRMRELGLSVYLRTGEGDAKLGIKNEISVMEDLFESIIGAIYIDSGMDMPRVIKSVSLMLSAKDYLRKDSPPIQSYKNALQEWCADKSHRFPPPVYKTVSESGPEHKKLYERGCYIGERLYAVGSGKNLKLADSDAAQKTLEILKSEQNKKAPQVSPSDAVAKLMDFIRSSRLPSPSFIDMGECEDSTPSLPKFSVCCKVSEHKTIGTGMGKSDARADSAFKMLKTLKKAAGSKKSQNKAKNTKKKI